MITKLQLTTKLGLVNEQFENRKLKNQKLDKTLYIDKRNNFPYNSYDIYFIGKHGGKLILSSGNRNSLLYFLNGMYEALSFVERDKPLQTSETQKEILIKSGKIKTRTFELSKRREDYLGEIASDCINEIMQKGYDNYDQLEEIVDSHLDQLKEENEKRYVLNLITDKLDLSHKDVNQLEKDLVEALSGDFG